MARINIEECWWSDSRRTKLIRIFKGDARLADGLMIQAWRQAQEFSQNQFLIPLSRFLCLEDAPYLFDVELAEIRLSDGPEIKNIQANTKQCLDEYQQRLERASKYVVYVKGSDNHLSWIAEKRAIASIGGKKSAQRTRDSRGRLLPKLQAESKQCLDNPPSESKTLQPSLSSSCSKRIKNMGEMNSPCMDELYKIYPRRKGDQRKKAGMKVLQKLIETGRLEDIRKAITNYAAHCKAEDKIGTPFVQQFKTFMSQTWEEWITPPNGTLPPKMKVMTLEEYKLYEQENTK